MKPACFACLLLFIAATLFAQSTPVSLINQHPKVVPPVSASQADLKEQAKILDSYGTGNEQAQVVASPPTRECRCQPLPGQAYARKTAHVMETLM